MTRKYAWTWADYDRELAKDKRREERAAARRAETAQPDPVAGFQTAARARPDPLGDRCEGEAPAGASGAATDGHENPANASSARPFLKRPTTSLHEGGPVSPTASLHEGGGARVAEVKAKAAPAAPPRPLPPIATAPAALSPRGRIVLADAPSAMEASADRWRAEEAAKLAPLDGGAEVDGSVICRCGSRHGRKPGPVPAWFGRDCIEVDCDLRRCR